MEHAKRRLRTYVHVPHGDQEHGTWFGPDDDLPQWAVEQLAGNPAVWADDTETEGAPTVQSMIGGVFEEGSLISTPFTTTAGLLPPSSTPSASPSRDSGRTRVAGGEEGLAEAERRFGVQGGALGTAPDNDGKGIAEARRRFGPPPGDAA